MILKFVVLSGRPSVEAMLSRLKPPTMSPSSTEKSEPRLVYCAELLVKERLA